jgi:hypothetical protein
MCFLNIHDGGTHRLNDETLLVVPQTFEMVFRTVTIGILSTKASLQMELRARLRVGLLKRYPVTASGFPLIGKETERGWEQADDTSTLLPSLLRYQNIGEQMRQRLRQRLLHGKSEFTRFSARNCASAHSVGGHCIPREWSGHSHRSCWFRAPRVPSRCGRLGVVV